MVIQTGSVVTFAPNVTVALPSLLVALPPAEVICVPLGGEIPLEVFAFGSGALPATAVTRNERVTSAAAAYVAFPDCEATIVHVPAAIAVTTAPATLQMLDVVVAKATARLLVAVAVSVTVGLLIEMSPGAEKVIVCDEPTVATTTAVTWNELVTSAAGAYVASPVCEAVIVHVPAATSVTAEPETVQTEGVVLV